MIDLFPASTKRFFAVAILAPVLVVTSAYSKDTPTPAAGKVAVSPADAAAQIPDRVTSVEGITEYRLPNGLRVLLFPDQSKPTVTVNVTYLVGSRQENYGETGMAHLLEHLMFKGTPNNPAIDKEFNKRGMRINGTTSLDRTNYYELFQAGDDNLEWALQMEADRMINSFIAKKDLDSEMTVVRNEYEQGENAPFRVLIKRMQSIAFDWHNYGNSTIGNRSDIENVKIENLQGFYRQYYQPDNAVLLVAGKFDEAKVLQWIAKYFGVIAKPERVLPKLWTVEPTQDGERNFVVRRKGDIQIVLLAYKVPSGLHDDADAIGFINFLLTNSPSGRLHKALVETGKAAQIFGFPLMGVDPGLHMIGAVVKKGEPVEPVQAELTRIVEELYKNPPTAEEMDRARKSFANSAERALNNHENIGLQMSEYISQGDWRLFFQGRDRAETLPLDRVKEVAAKYYKRDNRTTGLFTPEDQPQRAEIPAAPTIAEALKDFKPKQATSNAEAFDPSQANIDKRSKHIDIGGLKVVLLQKQNRGESVNVSMRFHTGDEKSLFGQQTIGSLTSQMLMRGTTKYSRAQLKDEFEKLKVAGGVNGLGGSFQTTKQNVVAAIRLAAHTLREPAFPESEFAQLKKLALTSIDSQRSDPTAMAGLAISRHFNTHPKGDWRYAPSIDESIESVKAATLEDVKKFHKKFYGANRGEIAIVGDFDEAEVTKAIKETLGDWKTDAPYARLVNKFSDIAPTNVAIETPDKENAVFRARVNVNMNEDDADYPALFLANYIMGGGAGFDSRFMARIRVKDGLSYGVGSGLSVGAIDRLGAWNVQAIAAPQNIAKVEAAFREEVAKALSEGFTTTELASAKSGVMQQRVQTRAQDASLANGWVSYLYLGKTFEWSKQFEDKILALNPEEVLAAMRKHIDPAKITIVKAGDFAKVAKTVTK
ncbi:MAG: pitrilysin family protein [Betaproteobacteria bacterium]